MKLLMCLYCKCWCCQLLTQLFLMSIFCKSVFSKCTVNEQDVTCFGSTWRQDLLPIENNSLKKLYISKCTEIQSQPEPLDINFLRNVSKLKILSITNCALIHLPLLNYQINSIETIDLNNNRIDINAQFPETLKRFPNLKVLNLANNRLTHLPKIWFDCPSQIETIILDGNLIGGLNPSLSACFVKLKHLFLRDNQFERLRMPSETRKLKMGVQIKETGGLRMFAEQGVFIRQGNKKVVSKGDKVPRSRHDYMGVIPQFKTLTTLDLSHNKIKSIDQIPLSKLENLNRLNVSHNNLSSKQSSGLSEIECDFGTAPFYINGNSGLVDLDLSSNVALTRIHSCWTFGLQNLQILRIRNCSITSIFDSSFEKMKFLTLLDLSHNKLSSVPKELTAVTKSLKWLSLAYNNISQMNSFYISQLENLRILNLSHNQFQNLMSFPVTESDGKSSDNLGDFLPNNRDPYYEEPINLLSQMKHLNELDLSFNDLVKLSATTDLSPSLKFEGELQRIDLRGNPSLTQFTDFNSNYITTFLTEFLVDHDLKYQCDCRFVGFIKWINQRHIYVVGRCSNPARLNHVSITEPKLLTSILTDPSCKDVSATVSIKAPYRIKLFSNANISIDSAQSDNDPMDDGQKKSSNQKRQVDHQKWIMTGNNLTLRCQFYSTNPVDVPINIEWQRLKQKPVVNSQQSGNIFLRDDKSERLDTVKYRDKIEHLSSNYDPRIKIWQIGPLDEHTIDEKLANSDETKLTPSKQKESGYTCTGYLLLKPVLVHDIGRYRCLINGLPPTYLFGQSQLISKEENIKVFTPPRFTSTPSNPMAIIEGETAEITCRAVGNPLPLTSLGRIGSKDFPAARGRRMKMFKDDSSFFITNVTQVDSGNYSCTSRNVAGTISHNFTLKVQMPATILNKVQSVQTITVGEALIIGFKVNGVPKPRMKWFKDGQIIVENDRIRFSSDQQMLVIQSTVLSDAGVYKISVLNALGGNDAFVTVGIRDSNGQVNLGPAPLATDTSQTSNQDKDRMPDYWLSSIIIIVILSMLITSILWITIFFCFSKIMGSKKRRLLLISNSQSRSSFDKTVNTTTTSFSNTRLNTIPLFKPLANCSIPLSLTSSTIVPRDQSQENIDIDTFTNSTKSVSEFYSPQLYHNFPLPHGNNRFFSQPYLSSSGLDLLTRVSQSSSSNHNRVQRLNADQCDSGIDSSQVYSETLNSSDVPVSSIYQCKHKSKHRNNNYQKQRKRYACSNSSDSCNTEQSKNAETNNNENRCLSAEKGVQLEIINEPNRHEQHYYNGIVAQHCISPLITDRSQYTSN